MGSRTILTLIRHAESECSRAGRPLLCGSHDAPLSRAGREQVSLLRTRLSHESDIGAVYSSPLRRALETAAAAPSLVGVRRLRSLGEIDCGLVEGLPIDQVRAEYSDLWAQNLAQSDEDFCWPGGETYRAFRRRVTRGLCGIARRHLGEQVLVFTHAGVVSQILGAIYGQSAARWEAHRPGNASICRLIVEGTAWQVDCFDDRAHLQKG